MMPGIKNSEVIIKKYANRRLYDTSASSYITLEDLCNMVKNGVEFIVIDAKTEEDLTRQVLTQIIFDQESKGYSILPIKFLRTIISFYGGKMQKLLPPYLEASMDNFTLNQDRLFDYFSHNPAFSPFMQLEEMRKHNIALFTKAFSMFNLFDIMPRAETEAEETQQRKAAGSGKK